MNPIVNKILNFIINNIISVGIAIGIILFIPFWPDSALDCIHTYCIGYHSSTTIPAWGHIILFPLSLFPIWTDMMIIASLTFGCIFIISIQWRINKWLVLLAICSPATLGVIWLGQPEFLILFGLILLVYGFNKSSQRIVGISFIFLSIKPQETWLLILCSIYWMWSIYKWDVYKLFLPLLGILSLSYVLYGSWLTSWLIQLNQFTDHTPYYPMGVLIIPAIFLPMSRNNKIIISLLIASICSPHIYIYHNIIIGFLNPIGQLTIYWVFISALFVQNYYLSLGFLPSLLSMVWFIMIKYPLPSSLGYTKNLTVK